METQTEQERLRALRVAVNLSNGLDFNKLLFSIIDVSTYKKIDSSLYVNLSCLENTYNICSNFKWGVGIEYKINFKERFVLIYSKQSMSEEYNKIDFKKEVLKE